MRGRRFTPALSIIAATMAIGCASGSVPDGGSKSGPDDGKPIDDVDPLVCEGIDIETDPSNCGECGRSCLGGTCLEGHCTPVTLYDSIGVLDDLAVSNGSLIAKESGQLVRIELPSGQSETIDTLETGWAYARLQVDAQRIYWGANGGLFAMPLQGGSADMLVAFDETDSPDTPSALGGNGVYFFKGIAGSYQLWRYHSDFDTSEYVTNLADTFSGRIVSANGRYAVFAEETDVNVDGLPEAAVGVFDSQTETVGRFMIAENANVSDIEIGHSSIWVAVNPYEGTSTVTQLNFDGTTVAGMPELANPTAMAADDHYLYVVARGTTYDRVCVVGDNGASFTLYEDAGIDDVVTDGVSVILRSTDKLIRIAKPTSVEASLAALGACSGI